MSSTPLMIEQSAGTALVCGDCQEPGATIMVVCGGCARAICRECVLDDELRTLRCYRCLDWTPAGRALLHALRRGRRRR